MILAVYSASIDGSSRMVLDEFPASW